MDPERHVQEMLGEMGGDRGHHSSNIALLQDASNGSRCYSLMSLDCPAEHFEKHKKDVGAGISKPC